MLQSERNPSARIAMQAVLEGFAASFWIALPGIVRSYDAMKGTCRIQPSVEGQVRNPDGSFSFVKLPLLADVPVIYMGGGGFVATFPINPDDEALVVFASRCIDSWWQSGGVQIPGSLRMHSLSDGFAIIGPRSLANSIPNVSTSTVQLRSLDGSTYYELAAGSVANIVAPGGVNITGPLNVSGDVSITGKVSATEEGTFNGIEVSQHEHSGVQAGADSTGPPLT